MLQSSSRHKFLLVMIDYATWYPKAVPPCNIKAETIARELTHPFTRVEIPKQVVSDKGTSFLSQVLQAVCQLLWVQPL